MNNLKDFQQFNEELNFDTYTNAAKKLHSHGHEDRSKELVKHALDMKMKKYGDAEFILWPNSPSILKEIKAEDKHGSIYFNVIFTDLEKKDRYSHSFGSIISSDERFEFLYYNYKGEENFRFTSSKEDFDGDETTYRLFTNRQDAIKFKKMFGQWLMENGYEKCIPAFNRMSINTLYTGEKPNTKHYRRYSDD